MDRCFEKWDGCSYLVRVVTLPEHLGYVSSVRVASRELWNAYEYDVYEGNKEATSIDDTIFFYVDEDFFSKDPTDEELVSYLIDNIFVEPI